MTHNTYRALQEKNTGDTAVDGLIAGLAAGAAMIIILLVVGWLAGTLPLLTMGYFDPAQGGSWLIGLTAHLAVSAIYGVVFALLLRLLRWIRPSLLRLHWLWGMGYGLLLLGPARVIVLTAVAAPLAQIAGWNLALAHLVYGLVLGLQLGRNQ